MLRVLLGVACSLLVVQSRFVCSPAQTRLKAWCEATCNLLPSGCFNFCKCVSDSTFNQNTDCTVDPAFPAVTVAWCLASCRGGACPNFCSDACNPFSLKKISLSVGTEISGFQAPESVVHDPVQDVYFASSVSSASISKFDPKTNTLTADFCVTQTNAPGTIGITILDRVIYAVGGFGGVVHMCNADSGAYIAPIGFGSFSPSPSFLNDIAADPATGKIYVSDAALQIVNGALVSTGGFGLFQIDTRNGNALTRIAINPVAGSIQNPNGILVLPDSILVSNNFLGSATILQISKSTLGSANPRIINSFPVPAGIDGIIGPLKNRPHVVILNGLEEVFLLDISSGKVESLLRRPCADIAFDATRNVVLCPVFGSIPAFEGRTVTTLRITDTAVFP